MSVSESSTEQNSHPTLQTSPQRVIMREWIGAILRNVFFRQMTVWELEKMDCVWSHLHHKHNTFWHRSCPYYCRSLLPDDLTRHLQTCQHETKYKFRRYDFGGNFRDTCEWFRCDLEIGIYGRTTAHHTAAWPGLQATEPSRGFLFHLKHCHRLPNDKPPSICYGHRCRVID